MSRQARNKAVDGVVLFWESLNPKDRVEAVKRMLDTIVDPAPLASSQPQARWPKKGGQKAHQEVPSLQNQMTSG